MLFKTFDGRLMLVLHQPFNNARGKLFEIEDTGDTLRIKRQPGVLKEAGDRICVRNGWLS